MAQIEFEALLIAMVGGVLLLLYTSTSVCPDFSSRLSWG